QTIAGTDVSEAFYDMTIASGATINVGLGFTVSVTSALVNSGTLDNDGVLDVANGYSGQTGSLSGNGTHRLSGGNWNNSTGTFTPENSTVEMAGTAAQTIQGTTSFNNLIINNAGGVSIVADSHSITNTLTLTNGLFTTNNAVTLFSNASGTGRIAEITGGSITDNIIAQRYVSGNDDWRLLSSPVTGTTLADWQTEFWMSGFTGSTYPSNAFTSVYTYDETTLGDLNQGYVAATNSTDALTATTGFFAWVGALPVGSGISKVLDLTGTANTGNQVVSVTYTDDPAYDDSNDGWMLIGNPYPSDIDWSTVTIGGGVTQFAYVYDPSTSTYITLDQSTSTIIAQQQGFWVKASGSSGTVTFQESDKVAGGVFYKYDNSNSLTLEVNGQGYNNSTEIRLDENATVAYEPNFDAFKWYSTNPSAPNIMTLATNGFELDINTVEDTTLTVSVPVKLVVGISGMYSISIEDSSAMLTHNCLFLEDLHENITVDLRQNPSYTFYISDTVATARFVLHIGGKVQQVKEDVTCFGGEDGQIQLTGQGVGPWNYSVINISTGDTSIAQNVFSLINYSSLSAGDYKVSISNSNGSCAAVQDTITIEQPEQVQLIGTLMHVQCYGDSSGSINISVSGGTVPYYFIWDNGATATSQVGLVQGIYSLTVADFEGCENMSVMTIEEGSEILVSFQLTEPTCFGENDGVLSAEVFGGVSPYGYLWQNGTDSTELVNAVSGVYEITVLDSNSCSYSASITLNEPLELIASFSTLNDTVEVGELINFINSSQGATTYQWDFGDSTSSQSISPQNSYSTTGEYTVVLEIGNSGTCTETVSQIIIVEEIISGINALQNNYNIKTFISNNQLHIYTEGESNEEITLNLYNSLGQCILTKGFNGYEGNFGSITMETMAKGIYFVEIIAEGNVRLYTGSIVW
ncbi:MAG: PKD domain-containing protein, partial [Flavobacteriales bacterium]|nr:PKD domain-containing protein [Flavobacteriales bacterium]